MKIVQWSWKRTTSRMGNELAYLLLGHLQGLQVVADHTELLLQLDDFAVNVEKYILHKIRQGN